MCSDVYEKIQLKMTRINSKNRQLHTKNTVLKILNK
mgnify:CR=1 FL=1